ncbi:hypothetical protein Bpfe_031174 [Biomphalaria pfeifferi]|uniref:Uncharacterized protein n=1 Tax=Biomphalaria pfeifferi TaxID=112525 RepID=A0AAD8ANC0_BIOPF|nr:hypothetical protein Bpfe_031174 [Biomphalaria pfeifferi]
MPTLSPMPSASSSIKRTNALPPSAKPPPNVHPALARKRKPPEFEMPPEYTKYLQLFIEQVEHRADLTKNLKDLPPENRAAIQRIVAEYDALIEKDEAKFADFYEHYQKFKLYEDSIRKHLKNRKQKRTRRTPQSPQKKSHPQRRNGKITARRISRIA